MSMSCQIRFGERQRRWRRAGPFTSMINHHAPDSAHDLSDLLNISFVLAEGLRRVGVDTPRRLANLGAEAAWQSLRTTGAHDGVQTLLALEGAIQGVSWRALSAERRHELMHYFGHCR